MPGLLILGEFVLEGFKGGLPMVQKNHEISAAPNLVCASALADAKQNLSMQLYSMDLLEGKTLEIPSTQ